MPLSNLKISKPACLAALMGLTLALPGPVQAVELSMPLQQAKSGNFYIRATLSETVETNLLLDTGSGYVGLSAATFKHLEREPGTVYLRTISGALADGKTLSVPVYRIRELRLTAGCVLQNIEVAVFPKAKRNILGLNALARLQPFTFTMQPPSLTARNCE